MVLRQAILFLLVGSLAFISCKKKDPKEEDTLADFDRSALLANLGDQIIWPSYQEYQQKVDALQISAQAFASAPNLSGLSALRTAWQEALLEWQNVAMFEFGPAEQIAFAGSTNTFPTDTTLIQSNINSGTYNLATAANIDAKGYQALDFLLFGTGSNDNAVLAAYTSTNQATNRLTYLTDLTTDLKTNTDFVVNAWSVSGGNYLSTFKGDPSTSAGSPISLFLNAFNQSFESQTRASKLGIPAGALTFSQTPLPDRVEAFYQTTNSHLYLLESLAAFDKIYRGIGVSEGDRLGLDDYVKHTAATNNGLPLHNAIIDQLSLTINGIGGLPTPLSQTVVNNQADVLAAYGQLQKLVVLWKVDMMSAFGVLINYVDNDGD